MRKTFGLWTWIIMLSLLVGVPLGFAAQSVYRWWTAPPKEITIAGGQTGARFSELTNSLAREIEDKLGAKKKPGVKEKPRVNVRIIPTAGSLQNLVLLREGKADFGLYQSGTLGILEKLHPEVLSDGKFSSLDNVTFVANLEMQPAHFLVRRDAGIESPADLTGKTVSVGLQLSGSHAVSLALLEHFGLDQTSVQIKRLGLGQVKEEFVNGSLDAALITSGVHAPIFPKLFETGECSLLTIPHAEALAAKHVGLEEYKIPAGIYRIRGRAEPETDVHTVARRVQLLARSELKSRLVEEVARIALSEDFMKKNNLGELFAQGHQFAQQAPDFPMHPGAREFYDPGLHPLLPADFVEATEGIRSFIVWIAVSLYVIYRWFRRRKEHKLDRYIKELLAIEQESRHAATEESLLDLQGRVDRLKHLAFQSFTVHEINEELAISCFFQMCSDLTEKINATISRLKLHKRFDELSVVSRGEAGSGA